MPSLKDQYRFRFLKLYSLQFRVKVQSTFFTCDHHQVKVHIGSGLPDYYCKNTSHGTPFDFMEFSSFAARISKPPILIDVCIFAFASFGQPKGSNCQSKNHPILSCLIFLYHKNLGEGIHVSLVLLSLFCLPLLLYNSLLFRFIRSNMILLLLQCVTSTTCLFQ